MFVGDESCIVCIVVCICLTCGLTPLVDHLVVKKVRFVPSEARRRAKRALKARDRDCFKKEMAILVVVVVWVIVACYWGEVRT